MSTVLDVLRKAEEGRLRGGGGGIGDEPPPGPPRRRRPRLLWGALGVLALVVAFFGGLQLSNDGSDGGPTDVVTAEPSSGGAMGAEVGAESGGRATDEAVDVRVAAAPAQSARQPVTQQAPPESSGAAAEHMPAMSEKRRRALERVIERREERAARREQRRTARADSQGLRDAIRSAQTPEERNSLLEQFRERRRLARAERSVAAAQKRLEIDAERARVESANVAGRVPSTAPASAPPPAPPAPAVAAAPAPAPPPPAAAPAPAPVEVASAPEEEGLRRAPSNAPQVRINILQWSSDPGRRFAYVSVEGNPAMTQVREGESYQGLVVKRILPEKVEFAHEGTTFLLRAN